MSYIKTHPTLAKSNGSSKLDWYKSVVDSYLPSNNKAKILEIGPGLGEGIEYLKNQKKYENITAIDLDDDVVKRCEQIIGENMIKINSISEFASQNKSKFDLIIMYHVIEHVPKDEIIKTFKSIKNAMVEDGVLLVVTPNAALPIIGMDQYLMDFTHKTPFSAQSLEQSLRMSDFTDIEIKNIWPPKISILRLFQSIAQKIIINFLKIILMMFSGVKRKVMTHQILAVAKNDK